MSNRIDLTQFDSEKEWDLTGFDWLAKQADSEYVANAVRQVPDLIAELKRCYEEIDEVRWMLMQAYDGQKEREREIDYLRSYCLDNGVCPYCGEAQQDPALRENLGIVKICSSCEDKIYFGIEPNDNASE